MDDSKDIISSIKYNNIYAVLALKRSGHHGITNWLCQQTDKDSLYWDQCHLLNNEWKLLHVGAYVGYYNSTDDKLKYQRNLDVSKYSSVYNCFMSLEDFGYIRNNKVGSLKDILRVDNITPSYFVIINRDFYNWMCSLFTAGGNMYNFRDELAKMWKEFIMESLTPNILKDYKVIDINYNKWFSYINYRKEICSKLDLMFTDNGLNDMLRASSFNGRNYRNKAQEMDVLSRYKSCLNNKDYLSLIDDEIKDLSEKYFGSVPEEILNI